MCLLFLPYVIMEKKRNTYEQPNDAPSTDVDPDTDISKLITIIFSPLKTIATHIGLWCGLLFHRISGSSLDNISGFDDEGSCVCAHPLFKRIAYLT